MIHLGLSDYLDVEYYPRIVFSILELFRVHVFVLFCVFRFCRATLIRKPIYLTIDLHQEPNLQH